MLAAFSLFALLGVALGVRERRRFQRLSGDVQLDGERLRLAMESAQTVGWDWDVASGRDIWFGNLKTMFGVAGDSYVGKVEDFRRRVHPDDRELVWKAVVRARDNRSLYDAKFRVIREDGTIRWIAATGRFHYAENGEPARMVGIARDITDCNQVDDELRESQQQLASIVASAMDAIIVVDGDQRIRMFNAAAEKMFACDAAGAIGGPLERFVPERFRAAHREHVRQFGESGVTSRALTAMGPLLGLRADGREFPIEASIAHTTVGARSLYTVILRDITERKQAEEALRESEQRFRLVASTAPVMIWMSGVDTLCDYFNRGWLEFTGRPLHAELGNGWLEGVHADDMASCMQTYVDAFDRRAPFKMEYRLRRYDGVYRWVLDTGVPRFLPGGAFAGYIGSAIDVTDLRLAQQALSGLSHRLMDAQEKERTSIARELCDDVGQRMALLTIELDTLGQSLPDMAADLRNRVEGLCTRAVALGHDIEAISRRMHSSTLEYLGIASAAAAVCGEMSEQLDMEIDFSHDGVPDDLPKDVALALFRVLQEALSNAVEHARVRQVTVTLRGSDSGIELAVADSGIGFDPEAVRQGRGLGFVSIRQRLGLVGGEMFIESRPNVGTTIRAQVPLRSS